MEIHSIVYELLYLCLLIQIGGWIWQIKTRNADIADILWAFGIVLCSFIYYFTVALPQHLTAIWMLIFPGLWYLRLTIHLWIRYRIDHEDSRYAYLRSYWKENTQFKFLIFFLFQGFLIWLFSIPSYWLAHVDFQVNFQMFMACGLGVVSIIGVTLADWQLLKFKSQSDSSIRVCEAGLWRYSRHPNYFFEWLHWNIYPLLLFNTDYFLWSLVYPFLMLFFLLKISGIPFSEQQSLIKRGDLYREYQNRTNKFFPWKPKNHQSRSKAS